MQKFATTFAYAALVVGFLTGAVLVLSGLALLFNWDAFRLVFAVLLSVFGLFFILSAVSALISFSRRKED